MSSPGFTLMGTDANFIARQKNTFLALTEIENKINNDRKEAMEIDYPHIPHQSKSREELKTVMKDFRGKESLFKRPQNPAPKSFIKTIPDFKKNPHKWTKYSLENVDISDKTNTKAALSFLKDMEMRKKTEEQIQEVAIDQKIIFRKPLLTYTPEEETEVKPLFKSSIRVMPEYNFSQKTKTEKKLKSTAAKPNTNLKLDHLYEEDDFGQQGEY